jgi:beta-glucanase (GH16 family)
MKKIIFLLIFSNSIVFSQENIQPFASLEGEWILDKSFSDEFDKSKLDEKKWWDFNPAWHGRKPSHFARSNVKVKKGLLRLSAKNLDPKKVSIQDKARGYDKFSTAIIKSKERSHYGYYEARAKSMKAAVCNAFWLYDPLEESVKYREGEYSEEIDIFEVFGKANKIENQRAYYAAVHRYQTPYVESLVNKRKYKLENRYTRLEVDYDFHEDFHIYGLLWTPDELVWYLDGKEVFRRKNDFFKRPLYIIFDAEIMETWDGLPNTNDLPSTFQVDYLRVWRLSK